MSEGNLAGIWIANTDGSGMDNLAHQVSNPIWSPDGNRIAFSSGEGILVMKADGTEVNLVPKSSPLDIPTDWSPDGRFLLIETYRDVNREIFAVTLDGTQWINLSHNPAEDGAPCWSPDGDQIVFASDRDSPDGKQIFQIYLLDTNGGDISRLSDFPYGAYWPVWSPDGQKLAASVIGDATGNSSDVYILHADGKVSKKLTDGVGWNIPTDWSPDGKWVVINSRWGSNQTILKAADGGSSQVLKLSGWGHRWQPNENTHLIKNLDMQIPVFEQELTQSLALVNGKMIDGTGAEEINDAVILIENGKITAVGSKAEVSIPSGIQSIDLNGKTILPGFINAHVHIAHSAENLKAWVNAGVTTVCDLGSSSDPFYFAFRDATLIHPAYSRIIAAGPIITSPGGYPIPVWGSQIALQVTSAEDARQKVGELLDKGADIIKIALARTLDKEEVMAITDLAHNRGTVVLAHVDTVRELELAVDNGVDIAAHMVIDRLPDDLIQKMVARDFYMIPTAVVMGKYNPAAQDQILDNIHRFTAAGGKVALGDDYGNPGVQLGMPIQDIDLMLQAGLSPMQIILAGTQNAAHACHLEKELGTLEAGKTADILIIQGDPLADIHALLNVQMIVRDGVVIFDQDDIVH